MRLQQANATKEAELQEVRRKAELDLQAKQKETQEARYKQGNL